MAGAAAQSRVVGSLEGDGWLRAAWVKGNKGELSAGDLRAGVGRTGARGWNGRAMKVVWRRGRALLVELHASYSSNCSSWSCTPHTAAIAACPGGGVGPSVCLCGSGPMLLASLAAFAPTTAEQPALLHKGRLCCPWPAALSNRPGQSLDTTSTPAMLHRTQPGGPEPTAGWARCHFVVMA